MKNINKYLLALVCFTGLLISSCEKDSIDFDSPFELKENESIVLQGNNNGLTITLQSVNDSRCPINALCISAGNARVKLRMSDNSSAETFAELCLGFCDNMKNTEDSAIIRLNNISYTLILKEVSPFPELGKKQDKKALLIIRKE
ncbi:MAG: hypothetical protein B7X86_02990 [Sphingobacteriales bacterium 17-39-43]|uniref:hypothetical protein n=1 Tax=Daejeonella sp. TaxID=2805397 RepID=UPI000BC45B7A|nr:hypothetical protein [Daejeonella sp.]OYX94885.1 MAG: hypothetical protein B7Y76_10245 [Sphingobacteriia bacterium 35-40-5]OYZ33297.1 MAG: hypothetical protein B7Y24_02990 [Sphingobacteriales bacterium 16-39-50]OZA26706.1 MAG: hypothetical protein B7X86_02990 [Sphingobacteriales bacterium 17-39-43]HQT22310.1 hypothetical protein [Daejeonella sp.]HQT56849.1 hypothetical protein [Daejeonella sp.]